MEWVEAYIEDPVMIAEYVIYLEQNFCQGDFTEIASIIS